MWHIRIVFNLGYTSRQWNLVTHNCHRQQHSTHDRYNYMTFSCIHIEENLLSFGLQVVCIFIIDNKVDNYLYTDFTSHSCPITVSFLLCIIYVQQLYCTSFMIDMVNRCNKWMQTFIQLCPTYLLTYFSILFCHFMQFVFPWISHSTFSIVCLVGLSCLYSRFSIVSLVLLFSFSIFCIVTLIFHVFVLTIFTVIQNCFFVFSWFYTSYFALFSYFLMFS